MTLATRQRSVGLLVFTLFIVAIWSYALFYPPLNWPDEAYKVAQIGEDKNLYLRLLNFLGANECNLSYSLDSDASYGSNSLHINLIYGQECYYKFKTVNTALACTIFLFCLVALRGGEPRMLFMLSLIWPAGIFYVTGINQQVVFHIVSTAIVAAVIFSARTWPYLVASVLLVLLDRSFIALVVFLGLLLFIRRRPKLAVLVSIILAVAAILLRPYVDSLTFILGGEMSIGELSESLASRSDSWLKSFALFFVSFVYLGGTSSIFGFGFDYGIVFLALTVLLYQNRGNHQMSVYLGAFLLTFIIVVSYVPTLQTYRYYVFVMPAILYLTIRRSSHVVGYVSYSGIMLILYLFQAAFKSV